MSGIVSQAFVDYYLCPAEFAQFALAEDLSQDSGYFKFGENNICYGRSSRGFRAKLPTDGLYDAMKGVEIAGSLPRIPFDPTEVIENLRLERYTGACGASGQATSQGSWRNAYYIFRDFLPASWRRGIQKLYFRGWVKLPFPAWPIDRTVESIIEALMALSMKAGAVRRVPFIWFWPDGLQACVIMTHDVETLSGRDCCSALMELDDSFGIKASFQIVPVERYP